MTTLVREDQRNNFNAIRIAMALLVVWSHSFALYVGSEATEPLSRLTAGVMNAGDLAVDVFFMVSGLLIAQSFDRSRSARTFLKKRVARIYPAYLVAVALFAFVLLPWYAGQKYTSALTFKTVGLNLLLRNWFAQQEIFVHNPASTMNGSLWSIPFEFWCYLGVLGLGLAGMLRRSRRWLILSLFFVLIVVKVWLDVTGRKPGGGIIGVVIGWPYLWFRMLPCFLAGTLAYLYRDVLPRSTWLLGATSALFLIATHLRGGRLVAADCLIPLVVPYATFYVAYLPRSIDLAKYGDFSYGCYLYAFTLQQLLKAFTSLDFAHYVLASMVLSLLAGAASWYCVERWFLTRASRLLHGVTVDETKARLRTQIVG